MSSEVAVATALTSSRHQGLAFTAGTDSFVGMLGFLQDEGLIEFSGQRLEKVNDLSFRLTLAGWRRVEELERQGAMTDAAFVAMPFAAAFNGLWSLAIEPALRSTGWRPVRADREHHNQRIDDWIMNQIRAARFLVVETTGSNPGACFEAGYALGLGKPVVWIAQEADVKASLHFDIRQYSHLRWTQGTEAELRQALADRIVNTIGEGPAKS
jgi:hypothetical protein